MHCLKTLASLALAGVASVAASPIASAAEEKIPTAALAISKADPGAVHTPKASAATPVPTLNEADAAALGMAMTVGAAMAGPGSDGDALIGENTAKAIADWVESLNDPEVHEHEHDAAATATSSVDPLESLSPIPFEYFPEQDLPLVKVMLSAKKHWRDEEDAMAARQSSLAPRDVPAPTGLSKPEGAHKWDLKALKKVVEVLKDEKDGSLDSKTMMQALRVYMIMKQRLNVFDSDTHLSKRDRDAVPPPATTPAPTTPVPTTSAAIPPTTTTPTISEMLQPGPEILQADGHFMERLMELIFKHAKDEATAVPPLVTLSPALASEVSRLPVEAQVAVSSMLKHNSETAFYPSTSDAFPPWATLPASYATEYGNGDFYPSTSDPYPPTTTVMATFTDPSLNTPRSATASSPSPSTFVTVPTKASESGEKDWPITGYIPAESFYPVAETDSYGPAKLARDVAEPSPSTEPFRTTLYPMPETDSYPPASNVVESSPTPESFRTTIPPNSFYPVAETDSYGPVETNSMTTPFRTTIPPASFYPVAETDSADPANVEARDLPLVNTYPQTGPFATYIPASAFHREGESDVYVHPSPAVDPSYSGYIPALSFHPVDVAGNPAPLTADAYEITVTAGAFDAAAETDGPAPERLAARDVAAPPPASTTPFRTTIPAESFYPYPPPTAEADPLKLARDAEKTPAPAPTKTVTLTHDPQFDNPRATVYPADDSYRAEDVPRPAMSKDEEADWDKWVDNHRIKVPQSSEEAAFDELVDEFPAQELETRGLKDAWKKFHDVVKFFPSPIKPMGGAKERREDDE